MMMDVHENFSSIQMKVTEKMKGFPLLASRMTTEVHEAVAALVEDLSGGFDQEGSSSPTITEGSRNTTNDSDTMYGAHSIPTTPGSYLQQEGVPNMDPSAFQNVTKVSSADFRTTCAQEEDDDEFSQYSHKSEDFDSSDDDDDSSHDSFEANEMDPMKVLKKGAVATLGGTVVGVGLIMIPLPTPFGAVVASSGMAVLATEFEGAKELNDKMISQAKTHWKTAREKIVQGIEEMNKDDMPTEIKATDPELDGEQRSEVNEETDEQPPKLMNDLDAKRQAQLVERAQRTKRPEFVDEWRKNAGAYLTKHLVPLLTTPLDENENDSSLQGADTSNKPNIHSNASDKAVENAQPTNSTPWTVVPRDSKDQEAECNVVIAEPVGV